METEVEDTSAFESTIATSFTKSNSVFQSTSVTTSNAINLNQSQLGTSDIGLSKVLRYTTSIATISTPKNAIRVASRRKPPFTADTFKLSLCSPRDTFIQSISVPAVKNLDLPLPFASSTPQCSIRRRPDRSGNSSESIICFETTSVYVHDEDYRKCIERLEKKVLYEEKHIAESAKKITFWKHRDNNKFSMNELCAHALLLISKTRLNTYQELVTRVQTLHRMSIVPPSIAKPLRASFTIYSMQINLCRGYYVTGPDCGENYVFLITFSTGEKVVATEIIQGNDGENIRSRRLRVDEPVHLANLPMIFQIKMDIYALKIVPPASNKSPKDFAKKAFNFIGHCRTPGHAQHYDDSSDSDEDETAFKPVGHAYLTRDSDGHTSFLITENEYPLDGSMEMKCEVTKLPEGLTEEMVGYWNLCGDSGFNKLWVKMNNGILYFYDHHTEEINENFIEPTYLIDMSTICNRQVEREMSVFKDAEHKYTFYMDVLSFPRGSDLCEHKRYLISLATEELLVSWLSKINNCLDLIRDRPVAAS